MKAVGRRKPQKGKKVMKQAGGPKIKDEIGETDDLVYSHEEREPTTTTQPNKWGVTTQ